MPARLVHKADFERLLGVRPCGRSAHFAVHHVVALPQVPRWRPRGALADELSTADAPLVPAPVDDSLGAGSPVGVPPVPAACWLGCVVPKRNARRAVTRNLVKRQVRSAFDRHAAALPPGLWLVRLVSALPVTTFVSAKSALLAGVLRGELDALLVNGLRRPAPRRPAEAA